MTETSLTLAAPSTLPYQLPDFAAVSTAELGAAVRAGMAQQRAEVEDILASDDAPTVANTVVALELSGQTLRRAASVLGTLVAADATPDRQALHEELSSELAAHEDAILLDPRLAARVAALDPTTAQGESARLLEVLQQRLAVEGAHLPEHDRTRLQEINERVATLSARFHGRLVEDTARRAVLLTDESELAGLSEAAREQARRAAQDAGHDEGWLLGLSLFTSQPWLADLAEESVQRRVFEASRARGQASQDSEGTLDVAMQLVRLRLEKARLLGSSCWAEHALKDRAAGSVAEVEELLSSVAPAAMDNARADAATIARARGDESAHINPWQWPALSAQYAREHYAVDHAALRPYFELESVLERGVFAAAQALYGLEFTERPELRQHLYRPDVRVWEVSDEDGAGVGLFVADLFARPTKSGGAWMHTVRDAASALDERPVVFATMNLSPAEPGAPTLLSLDELTTLFHEFGHVLHALVARAEFARLSGPAVPQDVVEFPSQVNEFFWKEPRLLQDYARHVETGEPLPAPILEAVEAAALWGEGYRTVEYLGAALIDWAWHSLTEETVEEAVADPLAFEDRVLREAGLDPELVPPRYRTGYFKHIFAGGYAAGYYSYLWAEVLDADAVEWFEEHGGMTRDNGRHFADQLLSRGNTREMGESYRAFRGRDPHREPLLRRRGLLRD
ncbi:MAG: M3 family metallopeptidase [Micrococcus sp.]|nr:M3 family metallopeptidase [Micrococcus sp.]